MKLYLVEIKCSGSYKFAYILSENCSDAYNKYKDWLDKNNVAYSRDREMESVKLLAEEGLYPASGRLFL